MPLPPIRAIVARFGFEVSRETLERVLRERPFDFCAHIAGEDSPRPFAGIPEDRQELFPSSEVRNAFYAGVDWNGIAPLGEDVIMRMRECEAVFMALVSRLEWKRGIPFLTRKLWYLRHLQFWDDYLTRRHINLYLSAWVPHEIPDIVIYHLCKLRGIPVLYFNTTELRDVSFAEHDIRESAAQILPRYRELLAAYEHAEPDAIPLSLETTISYEQSLLPKTGEPPPIQKVKLPLYWEKVRRLLRAQPLRFLRFALEYLVTPAGWQRALRAVQRWHVIRSRERFYAANATPPDLTRPFVYFALHFQPEATTLPMGGAFADLILAARILNAALPEGVLIYVKEHPRRSGWVNRSVAYYKEFLELAKVRFVPIDTDTFELREHCKAVATITGSPGFEALFREKPVFLFGSRFYQHAKGVFSIRSLEDCKEAAHAIFEQHEAPTHRSTRLYLRAIEETCVQGVLDPWSFQISHLPKEEHVRVMGDAIAREIGRLDGDIAQVP